MLNVEAFMSWVDHLQEVGDPIQKERTKLLGLAREAIELEQRALALRDQVAAGKMALLKRVLAHWTLADVEAASLKAGMADRGELSLAKVDTVLGSYAIALDGGTIAAEALDAFERAIVNRRPDGVAPLETAELTKAWWVHVGQPIHRRLCSARQATARGSGAA